MGQNKGGAPKKDKATLKSERITVRFTPGELERIEAQARRLKISKGEVIRAGALGLVVQEPVSQEYLAEAQNMARLGSNINQCAKRLAQINLNLSRLFKAYEQTGHLGLLTESQMARLESLATESKERAEQIEPHIRSLRAKLEGQS